MSEEHQPVIVLFSGGRDSSLAACLLAQRGLDVHLLTCNNGVSIGSELSDYRYNEIQRAVGKQVVGRTVVSTMGLFRRIALADIEDDFARFGKNLIVLGSQLAMHTESVVFSLSNSIPRVATGFTRYQQSFAEQMPEAIELLGRFLADYDIEYLNPVSEYKCPDDVKFGLLDFGVSTKSLEAVSIFADTFSEPSAQQVIDYIDAKLQTCREYIELKRKRGI